MKKNLIRMISGLFVASLLITPSISFAGHVPHVKLKPSKHLSRDRSAPRLEKKRDTAKAENPNPTSHLNSEQKAEKYRNAHLKSQGIKPE